MDIDVLGTQFYSQVPMSLNSVQNTNPAERNSFGELLEKAQKSKLPKAADAETSMSSKSPAIDKNDKLYELCMELETFLIKNLIKGMRSTVQKSSLIDTGFAGEVYEDMLYDEYAKAYAKNANFGFAEMAYRELSGLR